MLLAALRPVAGLPILRPPLVGALPNTPPTLPTPAALLVAGTALKNARAPTSATWWRIVARSPHPAIPSFFPSVPEAAMWLMMRKSEEEADEIWIRGRNDQ